MQNIFQQHPFSTPAGGLIEHATDPNLISENWALKAEICELINETDEGPKDAIRAIRKRLTSTSGRSNASIWYSLLLLEYCVKHCGRRFHIQVTSKEFLQDLIKVIGAKNDPPPYMQDKVLSMIQTWAEVFKGQSDLKEAEKMYEMLKQKGLDFPPLDLTSAPIRTPKRSYLAAAPQPTLAKIPNEMRRPVVNRQEHMEENMMPNIHSNRYHSSLQKGVPPTLAIMGPACQLPSNHSHQGHLYQADQQRMLTQYSLQNAPQMQIVQSSVQPDLWQNKNAISHQHRAAMLAKERSSYQLTSEQRSKLSREMRIVEGNVKVMNDMLSYLLPDTIQNEDFQLLQELCRTCHMMQQRIVELIDQIAAEEITSELLRINDDLNNAFLCYERFARYHRKAAEARVRSQESIATPPSTAQPECESIQSEEPLIDLSPDILTELGIPFARHCDLMPITSDSASTVLARGNGTDFGCLENNPFYQEMTSSERPASPVSTIQPHDSVSVAGSRAAPVCPQAFAAVCDPGLQRLQSNTSVESFDKSSDAATVPETPDPNDFDEITNWLQHQKREESQKPIGGASCLKEDFDRFLSEQVRLTAAQVQQKSSSSTSPASTQVSKEGK